MDPDPQPPAPGTLVLVGTPIGNLGDLPPRAVEALSAADAICCEDTRRTGRLLAHAGVERRPLIVVNDHTENREVGRVLARLARGERVAVVTDAGMPGISDPGERLVRAAARDGHTIEVVPGPSAAIAGLVVSGLPASRFVFEGFLPRKGAARTERLAALAGEARTIVAYEAPHRVGRTLADLASALGPHRRVAVARELTKLHEEVWRGTPKASATAAAASRAEAPAARRSRRAATRSSSPGGGASGAPSTTRTISPGGSRSAAQATASASVPRHTSSCSLVSSRATATRRWGPRAEARSASVRPTRWGAS